MLVNIHKTQVNTSSMLCSLPCGSLPEQGKETVVIEERLRSEALSSAPERSMSMGQAGIRMLSSTKQCVRACEQTMDVSVQAVEKHYSGGGEGERGGAHSRILMLCHANVMHSLFESTTTQVVGSQQ
jgi:hypothetical protein